MAEKRDWQTKAERELKGRDATWHVPEGFAIQPLYTAEDAAPDPGLPGFVPFTRGPYASMSGVATPTWLRRPSFMGDL